MKDFHCSDTGQKCDFVATDEYDDLVLGKARTHTERDHQMPVTPDMIERLRGLIHDQDSEEHKLSVQRSQ